MPLTITGDKGSELGLLIALSPWWDIAIHSFWILDLYNSGFVSNHFSLRRIFPHSKRSKVFTTSGASSGYNESDIVHSQVKCYFSYSSSQLLNWQQMHWKAALGRSCTRPPRWNSTREPNTSGLQAKWLTPAEWCRIYLYEEPQKYSQFLKNRLIDIPPKELEGLLAKHDWPDLFLFCCPQDAILCEKIHFRVGSSSLIATLGWETFQDMVNYYICHSEGLNVESEREVE